MSFGLKSQLMFCVLPHLHSLLICLFISQIRGKIDVVSSVKDYFNVD